jgi:hypothetical protein
MAEPYRTMAEIEATYPNEWVLIDEPGTDANGDVAGGRVVWHHPDLTAFNDRLMDYRRPRTAILYVGTEPRSPDEIDVISVWTSGSTPG